MVFSFFSQANRPDLNSLGKHFIAFFSPALEPCSVQHQLKRQFINNSPVSWQSPSFIHWSLELSFVIINRLEWLGFGRCTVSWLTDSIQPEFAKEESHSEMCSTLTKIPRSKCSSICGTGTGDLSVPFFLTFFSIVLTTTWRIRVWSCKLLCTPFLFVVQYWGLRRNVEFVINVLRKNRRLSEECMRPLGLIENRETRGCKKLVLHGVFIIIIIQYSKWIQQSGGGPTGWEACVNEQHGGVCGSG